MLTQNYVNADDNGKVFIEAQDEEFLKDSPECPQELLLRIKQAAFDGVEPNDNDIAAFAEAGRASMLKHLSLDGMSLEDSLMSLLDNDGGCDHDCEHCHRHDEDEITDEEGEVLMGLFVPAIEAAAKYVKETAATMNEEDSLKFRRRACIGMLNTIVQSQEQEDLCIASCGFKDADELRQLH